MCNEFCLYLPQRNTLISLICLPEINISRFLFISINISSSSPPPFPLFPPFPPPPGLSGELSFSTKAFYKFTSPSLNQIPMDNKLLSDLVPNISFVPLNYIRPASNRPNLDKVSHDDSIPLIDLCNLNGPKRNDVVKNIGQACENYGFFQVHNIHSIG